MPLSAAEEDALFTTFESSAFRMETHQIYTMPAEQAELARFLAGEPIPDGFSAEWHAEIRGNRAAGKTMTRLKIVRQPLTDYTRFLLAWAVPGNVAAGEDYRIITGADADELGIPEQDFWMFDGTTVMLQNFGPDGTLRGKELADPSDLGEYVRWRDLALARAVPFGDYRP